VSKGRTRLSYALRDDATERCSATCFYCGAEADYAYEAGAFEGLTTDHVMPVVLGGTDDPENLVAACFMCNSKKGARLPTPDEVERAAALYLNWVEAGRPKWATMSKHRRLRRDFVAGVRMTDEGAVVSPDLMLQFGRGGMAPALLAQWLCELAES